MRQSPKSDVVVLNLQTLLTPLSILVGTVIVAAVLLVGLLSINSNVKKLTPGYTDDSGDAVLGQEAADPVQVDPGNATTSIDDDPYLGNKDEATVAIVEFSDFECPFCQRFHQETFEDIVKNYVDTGKAIIVYRDLPLSFHDPVATKEAIAGECVKEQGGNEAFFNFAQGLYNATASNGQGVSDDKLYSLASDAGVDSNKVKECVESEKYKEEVQNDAAAAQSAGVTGTPGFVVGKLQPDGTVTEGTLVAGAQPYDVFASTIDSKL